MMRNTDKVMERKTIIMDRTMTITTSLIPWKKNTMLKIITQDQSTPRHLMKFFPSRKYFKNSILFSKRFRASSIWIKDGAYFYLNSSSGTRTT